MLEVLEFIFSSFWVWLGTLALCAVIFGGLGGAIHARTNTTHSSLHKETIRHG